MASQTPTLSKARTLVNNAFGHRHYFGSGHLCHYWHRPTQDGGSAIWISFVIASVVAGLTGLSYAELASMFPDAGASPVYVRKAFGPRAGFLLGWLRLIIAIVSMAAVAIGFGGYFSIIFDLPADLVALLALALSFAIVVLGVRETVILAVVMTLLEAGGLIFILFLGIPDIGTRSLFEMPLGTVGLISGASLIFFAFEGFEQIATLSEEVRNPSRNIPRAILLSIAITTLLYVAVAVAVVSILDWNELATSESPLSDVALAASGSRAASILSIIALFATFNTVLMMLATAARRAYGMAGHGMLPNLFRTLTPRSSTPWVAAGILAILAAIVALIGDLRFAAEASNYSVFIAFLTVNAALVYLRIRSPEINRPFKIPFAIGQIPILPIIGSLGILILSFYVNLNSLLLVVGTLVIGLLLAPLVVQSRQS